MKIIFLHIVLFLYTASVLKPVLPVMVDLLAHTFQELEHTSTVHAHEGDQHLHLEMQSMVPANEDDAPLPKIEISITPHLLSKIEMSFFTTASSSARWGRMIASLPFTYLSLPSPPPKS